MKYLKRIIIELNLTKHGPFLKQSIYKGYPANMSVDNINLLQSVLIVTCTKTSCLIQKIQKVATLDYKNRKSLIRINQINLKS